MKYSILICAALTALLTAAGSIAAGAAASDVDALHRSIDRLADQIEHM